MNIIGHQKILDYLQKSIAKDKVAHGYLFYGPEKVGKKKVALEFAKILQCKESTGACQACQNCRGIEKGIHPDLTFIQPQEPLQEIGISQIRDLRKIFSLCPYEGNYKVAIIDEAERMSIEAANALLKTLEEPKGKKAVLILTSAFPHLLPKTVNSRLQQIKFSQVPNRILEDYLRGLDFSEEEIKKNVKISQGRPGILQELLKSFERKQNYKLFVKNLINLKRSDLNKRFEYIKELSENRQGSIKFLEAVSIFFRDLFLIRNRAENFIINIFFEKELTELAENYSSDQLKTIIKLIRKLQNMLSFSNVNSRLCLEVLMLEL